MHLSENIKIWRLKRGLTQEGLANAIGNTRPYIVRLENDTKLNLTVKTLSKIAKALSIHPSKLLEDRN